MSHVVKVHNQKFILPKNPNQADKFMGIWVEAQNQAISKVTHLFLKDNDLSEHDFDLKVDEYTVKFYKQMTNGGTNVYRRKLKT